jgi:arginine/lysine/ornithine decarboxylase
MKPLPLIKGLIKFCKKQPSSFHTPGHKWGTAIEPGLLELWGREVFKYDHTELPDLDNLHNPKGIIKESMELASKIYGSQRSFYLLNGATAGIHSIFMAVKEQGGKRVVFQRDSHMSAYWGLVLTGIEPIYIYPKISKKFNIPIGISLESIKKIASTTVDGVFLTTPNYYGVTETRKAKEKLSNLKVPLLIDEAHGSHYRFHEDLPLSFQGTGGDIVVHSCHKNLTGLTQTGVLHCNNPIYLEYLERSLRFLQSSSPSYILMTSIESAIDEMNVRGKEHISKALELSYLLRERLNLIDGLELLEENSLKEGKTLDPTRVLINTKALGNSMEVGTSLRKRGIEVEMIAGNNILLIITHGNSLNDIHKVIDFFKKLKKVNKADKDIIYSDIPINNKMYLNPREAYFGKKKKVPINKSLGRISGDYIIPYPPGVPILIPGEVISLDVIEYVTMLKGDRIIGINNDTIAVMEEE